MCLKFIFGLSFLNGRFDVTYMAYIFLLNWFVFTLAIGWSSDYKKALICNIIATLSFAVYAYMIDQNVASATFILAGANSFIQLLLPKSENVRQKKVRNGIAVIIAIFACVSLFQRASELLLCLSFTIIRVCEAQQSPRIMKFGMAIGMFLYAAFGLWEGLYLMTALKTVIMITFLYKLYDEKKLAVVH